jgi:hypothetical protein
MEYLTDSEIIEWNNIVNNHYYIIYPSYNHNNGYPDIKYNHTYSSNPYYDNNKISTEFIFDFSFSILESGIEFFNKIKKSMFNYTIKNKVILDNISKDINLENINIDFKENKQKFKNKNYVKYSYKLKGEISDVMTFYTLIKRTLYFYELAWGIDSDGKEGLLLKFKIGDVVILNNNTNVDMIVVDYIFDTLEDFKIKYVTEDIIDKGSYILYQNKNAYSEQKLNHSRNNKLQILLEN